MIFPQQKKGREQEILGVRNAKKGKEIEYTENYKVLNSKDKPTDSWIVRVELKNDTDRGMVSGLVKGSKSSFLYSCLRFVHYTT
jgi:hypothetical protein